MNGSNRSLRKVEQVFTTVGVPTHTFVKPAEYTKLYISLRTPGKGLVVEGPSGIGKTTCVRKAITELGWSDKIIALSARHKQEKKEIESLTSKENHGIFIIDDFHTLKSETQREIADLMKYLADEESEDCKFVIVGINRAGDSLVKFAPDLTNRIDRIKFEANSEAKIEELIRKGEEALNIRIGTRNDIITEAQGSFNITQMLCLETCIQGDIKEEQAKNVQLNISFELIREKVFATLSGKFFGVARAFAMGPRLNRLGRAPYLHLLRWLGDSVEWSLNVDHVLVEHTEQRNSVSQIVEKGYLTKHISRNPEIKKVIHFDRNTRILSVEDPQFIYFLRNLLWSKFATNVGYQTLEFPSEYDFALSFSGSVRGTAARMYDILQEKGFSVFYDKNEQHRILSRDIEEYLAPIYKSEATYVIVLISRDYPKRVWTKFESKQFKERFADNSIIPVWFSNVNKSAFDYSMNIGGLDYALNKAREPQLQYIVKVIQKMFGEAQIARQGIVKRAIPIRELARKADFPHSAKGKIVKIKGIFGKVDRIADDGRQFEIKEFTGRRRVFSTSAVGSI